MWNLDIFLDYFCVCLSSGCTYLRIAITDIYLLNINLSMDSVYPQPHIHLVMFSHYSFSNHTFLRHVSPPPNLMFSSLLFVSFLQSHFFIAFFLSLTPVFCHSRFSLYQFFFFSFFKFIISLSSGILLHLYPPSDGLFVLPFFSGSFLLLLDCLSLGLLF